LYHINSHFKSYQMKQIICAEKECRRCHKTKPIDQFRKRPNGFTLNQCRECEGELGKLRRLAKQATVPEVSPIISITTKSGKVVQASTQPITGGRKATSPLTDKILYFDPTVNRDTARVAFSAYANVLRTGINFKTI